MWDFESLRAMNEHTRLFADVDGVIHVDVLYNIGPHRTVRKKMCADGHNLFVCQENGCQAITEDDLAVRPCKVPDPRPAGW